MRAKLPAPRTPKPLIRVRKRSPRVTPRMASEILALVQNGMHQHDVAARFGINQGRVSEIVNGKRFVSVEPMASKQFNFKFE
jgi:hypothetical protein